MNAKLYFNKSDKRYINKQLEQILPHSEGTPPEWILVEFIEPTSIVNPRLIFSTETNVLQANYLFLQDFGRYYYINNHTLEHGRVIVECHVDVLMSFKTDIMKENVIIEKASNNRNFYLDDKDLKLYNYSTFHTIPFTAKTSLHFDEDAGQMVMVCSGNT